MNVTLKPVSHPALGEINIDETRFPIGRGIETFRSLKDQAVSRLSRRHARIFQDDGEVFIIDLGSQNGTQVNGQAVKEEAVRLLNADLINFADDFIFRVEMKSGDGDENTLVIKPQPMLTLALIDTDNVVEPITITKFPFVITRNCSLFGQNITHSIVQLQQISSPHAVIGLNHGEIYIEDLISAEGTFMAGQQLEATPQAVADEAILSFGSSRHHTFRVSLKQAQQPERKMDTVLAGNTDSVKEHADIYRTVFVHSSKSFLEMYCAENDPEQAVDSDTSHLSTKGETGKALNGSHKKKGLITNIRRVLWNEPGKNRNVFPVGIGVISIVFFLTAILYLFSSDKREIKSFLENRAYIDSTTAANRYLERHPNDEDVNDWAVEALTKAIVPGWVERIEQRRFEHAESYLNAAKRNYPSINAGQQIFDLLIWAGKVEKHVYQRGGMEAPIVIFRHEKPISDLVTEWDADSFRHRLQLNQLLAFVPEFEVLHRRVISELRMLRHEHAVYGKAISGLKIKVNNGLANRDYQRIESAIANIRKQYPRVGGLDGLSKDIENVELIDSMMEQRALIEADRLSREIAFNTPLVRQNIRERLDQTLPPQEVITQYQKATDAWRLGQSKKALKMLHSLKAKPWGDVAERLEQRYSKINTAYTRLQDETDSDSYSERLLAFHLLMIPSQDEFFSAAVESEFQFIKKQFQVQLKRDFDRINTQWTRFQDAGGIPGVIRVEERVSRRFRDQAERLSAAYREISEGTRKYKLIKTEVPAQWLTLRTKIVNEARRQNQWLNDLDVVLKPTLLSAKLSLLPEIRE